MAQAHSCGDTGGQCLQAAKGTEMCMRRLTPAVEGAAGTEVLPAEEGWTRPPAGGLTLSGTKGLS